MVNWIKSAQISVIWSRQTGGFHSAQWPWMKTTEISKDILQWTVLPGTINKIKLTTSWNMMLHSSEIHHSQELRVIVWVISDSLNLDIYFQKLKERRVTDSPEEMSLKVRETIPYPKSGRLDLQLSQFVSFNILLKCHLATCSGPFCSCSVKSIKKWIKSQYKHKGDIVTSYHCPQRRSGRDQKSHFLHSATHSRCSGHQYQL